MEASPQARARATTHAGHHTPPRRPRPGRRHFNARGIQVGPHRPGPSFGGHPGFARLWARKPGHRARQESRPRRRYPTAAPTRPRRRGHASCIRSWQIRLTLSAMALPGRPPRSRRCGATLRNVHFVQAPRALSHGHRLVLSTPAPASSMSSAITSGARCGNLARAVRLALSTASASHTAPGTRARASTRALCREMGSRPCSLMLRGASSLPRAPCLPPASWPNFERPRRRRR